MRVRNLFFGLVALCLLSGTVVAQMPPPSQPPTGLPGQFNQAPSPAPEDHSSSNAGTWILVALGVGVGLWLLNAPKKRQLLIGPVPRPQQGAGCAVLIGAGVAILALAGVALACL
jgi:hypothetical protein